MIASISVMLLAGFVFLGVIQGLASGEPGQALFRLLRDIPVAVLAIVGFPWLVDQLLTAADGLSAAILPSGATARQLITNQLLENLKLAVGGGLAGLLIAFVAFVAFVALALVYLELVVRDVLIHLAVGLAPLSYAAFVWPAARGAARKVAEFVAAGVLAKPAIFLALRIGLDLVSSHGAAAPWKGAPWGRLLVGLAVVCVAAFTPWVVWRLLPHAEGMLLAQGLSRAPGRSAMQVLQTACWLDSIRSRVSFGGGGGGGRSGAGGGSGGLGPPRSLPTPSGPGGRPGASGTGPGGTPASGATGAAASGTGSAGAGAASSGAGTAAAGAAAGPAGVVAGGVVAAAQTAKATKDHVTASASQRTTTTSPASGQQAAGGAAGDGAGEGGRAEPPRRTGPSAGWSRRPPPGTRSGPQ